MLFGGLLQLEAAVPLGTFAEEVDVAASAIVYPVERHLAVDKAENLDTVEHACLTCPTADVLHGFLLAFGNSGRCYFDAVDIDLLKEHAGNYEFLVRNEADTTRLLSVAEGGVHDFYYACFFSHASILSLFSSRKSMSSKAFMRQYFL